MSSSYTDRVILICSILGGVSGLFAISALGIYFWQKRRENRRTARAWTGDRDLERQRKAPQTNAQESIGTSSTIKPVLSEFVEGRSTVEVQDRPPVIPLPTGWPRVGLPSSSSGARRAEKRREALGSDARASRLMDDTPFAFTDDTDGGSGEAISLSTAHAEAGSVVPSATPSRSTSRRGRGRIPGAWRSPATHVEGRQGRHSRAASIWSWSHRATASVASTDVGEPLPAYSFRRSGSTTRSRDSRMPRQQSRVSLRGQTGDVAGAHNFPRDLAKKIALIYKKPSRDVDPPEYTQTT